MRYNTEKFIEKSIAKHGDVYDYSQTIYSTYEFLTIVCKRHGTFKQKASQHLVGRGCPACGDETRRKKIIARNLKCRLTQEDFLVRAQEKHADRYDYSDTVFKGIRYPVEIKCAEHGTFSQMAQAHIINGQGCPSCFRKLRRTSLTRKLSTAKDFAFQAKLIHGDRFDYSQTDLMKRYDDNKVSIKCPEHGTFFVRPTAHLRGAICPPCAFRDSAKKASLKTRLSDDEFIRRAREVHGEKYSYEKLNYTGLKSKITVKCPIHDDFIQTASDHLNGNGCQKCANFATSKMENDWLDSNNITIRRKCIKLGNRRFYVDGYEPSTNTIYEFLGDYWHGNPNVFSPSTMNTRSKKTFGQLFEETMSRLDLIRGAGYNVNYIWERDWLNENNLQTRRSLRRT